MSASYDVIVVGSGFGGAVSAARLAAAGARVLVLERGRRWTPGEYPRAPSDAWIYDHLRPERRNGWLDVRLFPGMAVVTGAGVGGGSLCYSSVLLEATAERFATGWPRAISAAELAPHYAAARGMLGANPLPPGQLTRRHELLQTGAKRLGLGSRFAALPLAVSFDPAWNYDLPNPHDPKHARPFVNAHGRKQATCIHLGNCDLGCDVGAKNTLDLNYLAAAERAGAEVRPLHIVRRLEPDGTGYRVSFDRIEGGRCEPGAESAERVVLAAGSLGSTELLLRCRDEFGTLPRISRQLGRRWSPNANVLTPDVYPTAAAVQQSVGPTISAGLDFSDGPDGQRFILEDDGFPNLLRAAVRSKLGSAWYSPLAWALQAHLRRLGSRDNPLGNVAVWLGAGVDAGDGRLVLGRRWHALWRRELTLAWNAGPSEGVIRAIIAAQRRLSRANGGRLSVPFYWSVLRALITVHPLGGCGMGESAADGVVDHRGEVFGHPNLFVLDGSVAPRPIGRNPSLTIAALAERASALIARR